MSDVLGTLTELLPKRYAPPIVLIFAAGVLFFFYNAYSFAELLQDPAYQWTTLGIVWATLHYYTARPKKKQRRPWGIHAVIVLGVVATAYVIFAISQPPVTPKGSLGLYVARFSDDPTRKTHLILIEELLALKARQPNVALEVYELRNPMPADDSALGDLASKLNARVILGGRIVGEKLVHPRLWNGQSPAKRPGMFNSTDEQAFKNLALAIWNEAQARQTQAPPTTTPKPPRNGRPLVAALGALLIGIGKYGEPADLLAPENDIEALRATLSDRGMTLTLRVLRDSEVVPERIDNAIEDVSARLRERDPFIVYVSGLSGPDFPNKSTLYLPNGGKLPLAPVFRKILQRHPATMILIDGGFDLRELASETKVAGTIVAADPIGTGLVAQTSINGKTMGALTAAFIQTLANTKPNTRVTMADLFPQITAIMRAQNNTVPGMLGGVEPRF